MSRIVCDASSLISLSDNCLLWVLQSVGAEFLVPAAVKAELVDQPLRSRKFELKALRIKEFITRGAVRLADEDGVKEHAMEITRLANALFKYGSHNVRILHEGESESIALVKKLGTDALMIDERTTRLLIEDLEGLKSYIQHRTGFDLKMNNQVARDIRNQLEGTSVIRSSELLAYAFEKGALDELGGLGALHASLYGLKFSGCAITSDEIEEYVKMLG